MSWNAMEERIEAEPMSGCWIWTGVRNAAGYGQVLTEATSRHRRLAHRAIYERFRGRISAGLVCDHRCRNTSCVNPDHLAVVTPS